MRAIVIDAKLLVLLVIGLFDWTLIGRHRRTREFEVQDWAVLVEYLADYDQLVVTPHLLTEASNQLAQTDAATAAGLQERLAQLIPCCREEFVASSDVASHDTFAAWGLTARATLGQARGKTPLLTTDLAVYRQALAENRTAVNFHHLREAWMLDEQWTTAAEPPA